MAVALLRIVSPMEIPTGIGFSEGIGEGGLKGKVSGPKFDNIQRKKPRWSLYSLYTDSKYACVGFEPENNVNFPIRSSLVANPAGEVAMSAEQVYDVVLKQAALVEDQRRRRTTSIDVKSNMVVPGTLYLLRDAYDRCGKVCAEFAKTFYLGTLLMTPVRGGEPFGQSMCGAGGQTSLSTGPTRLTSRLLPSTGGRQGWRISLLAARMTCLMRLYPILSPDSL